MFSEMFFFVKVMIQCPDHYFHQCHQPAVKNIEVVFVCFVQNHAKKKEET